MGNIHEITTRSTQPDRLAFVASAFAGIVVALWSPAPLLLCADHISGIAEITGVQAFNDDGDGSVRPRFRIRRGSK